jgi:hypothetical protein
LLKNNPRLWQIIHLPSNFYHFAIEYRIRIRKNAIKENPPGFYSYQWVRFLAACFNDRKYIDAILDQGFGGIEHEIESRKAQIYWDIGWTLCDLGYEDEGVVYLEKGINLQNIKLYKDNLILALCMRLNNRKYQEKKLLLLESLAKEETVELDIIALLAQSHIEHNNFDKAKEFIDKLSKGELETHEYLWAYLYFAQKNFKAAVGAFEKHKFPDTCYFWRAEYDYKYALSCYYSGQEEKWRKIAMEIGRRKKWNKFYGIDYIAQSGVDRVGEIDAVINSGNVDGLPFDIEKMKHYFAMIRLIVWSFVKRNAAYILLVFIILLFVKWNK